MSHPGLAGALSFLRCPHCAADLYLSGGSARCRSGHAFDIARQGYVNLAPGDAAASRGDTADMVRARAIFLASGHFDGLIEVVAEECEHAAAGSHDDGCIVDVGAGAGHHLARVLDRLPGRAGVALDSSKPALRRAARAHPRIGAAGCDAWRAIPVRDAAAAVVLSVFAPRNAAEIARLLAPGGALVVVTPTDRHLTELVGALGLLTVDSRKRKRLEAKLDPFLAPIGERSWGATMSMSHEDVANLVAMGPSAHHIDPVTIGARVAALAPTVGVTASVTVTTYRAR